MNMPLHHAAFHLSDDHTRFEVFVSGEGQESERLAVSVPVKAFFEHLKVAKHQMAHSPHFIKLEPPAPVNEASWFNRATIERFVKFVKSPEVLERVNNLEAEILQLEEARKFQNAPLYSKGAGAQPSSLASATDGSSCRASYKLNEVEVESLNDSKRELLRAIDGRLKVVQPELRMAIADAAAQGFSREHLDHLLLFAQHFGADRLRDACAKFMKRRDLLGTGAKTYDSSPTGNTSPESEFEETENHLNVQATNGVFDGNQKDSNEGNLRRLLSPNDNDMDLVACQRYYKYGNGDGNGEKPTAELDSDMQSLKDLVKSSSKRRLQQRGKRYGLYSQKREAKLRMKDAEQRSETEAKFKLMEIFLQESKEKIVQTRNHSIPIHADRTVRKVTFRTPSASPPSASSFMDLDVGPMDLPKSCISTPPLPLSISTPNSNSISLSSSKRKNLNRSKNQLAKSVPNFADLRKENTKPCNGRPGPISAYGSNTEQSKMKKRCGNGGNLFTSPVKVDCSPSAEERKWRNKNMMKSCELKSMLNPSPMKEVSSVETKAFLRKGTGTKVSPLKGKGNIFQSPNDWG